MLFYLICQNKNKINNRSQQNYEDISGTKTCSLEGFADAGLVMSKLQLKANPDRSLVNTNVSTFKHFVVLKCSLQIGLLFGAMAAGQTGVTGPGEQDGTA